MQLAMGLLRPSQHVRRQEPLRTGAVGARRLRQAAHRRRRQDCSFHRRQGGNWASAPSMSLRWRCADWRAHPAEKRPRQRADEQLIVELGFHHRSGRFFGFSPVAVCVVDLLPKYAGDWQQDHGSVWTSVLEKSSGGALSASDNQALANIDWRCQGGVVLVLY
jgi:hypothetical protein